MAGKSNRRKKQRRDSSSSSSDRDEDPDYTAELPWCQCRQKAYKYSKEYQRNNAYEANEYLQNAASTSTGRAKRQCAMKKNDNKQGEMPLTETLEMVERTAEPGCTMVERFTSGRKRSSIPRRNRKFQDENGEGSMSRRVRGSEDKYDHGSHRYSAGKRRNQYGEDEKKKKKATIFSWLIDSGTIEEDEKVFCTDESEKVSKEGIIRREGILCSCCHVLCTAETFVAHGGKRSNEPFDLIFTSKHKDSLLSFMIDAWNKPEICNRRKFNDIQTTNNTSDKYDDACMICADGGNLMCCDECNSTYHQICVDLEVVPRGSWYCPYCVCKFCGDPASENDCLHECPQCGKKYHWNCHQRRDLEIIDLNNVPCAPFCERNCKEVHDNLKNMIGMKNELDEGFSWSLLQCLDNDSGIYLDDTYKRTVCHSKLAVALRLMEDCFEPIIDRHTRIDVIPSVVYNCGSNFARIRFKGFYTAVLEKDEEIFSVATLRIHGTNLSEMPFIATSDMYRGKGMCKKLMALCYLNVENLIIPSTSEMTNKWIEKYGFRLVDYMLNKEIIRRNTLMFHDSIRLQKTLVASRLTKLDRSSGKASWRKPRTSHHRNLPIFTQKTTIASMFDLDFQPPEWNQNPWMNDSDRMPNQ